MVSARNSPKKAAKTAGMFASKFCADVIDGAIDSQMANVKKNVTTTEKWLGKMKTSVLRKISRASKVAFLPEEQQPARLKELIEAEQEKIHAQTQAIREAATEALKANKLSQVQIVTPEQPAKDARFEKHVAAVSRQLTKVAHQYHSLSKSTDARIESLKGTLAEVEANWKKPEATSKSSSPKKGRAQSPSKKGMAGKLHDHMGSSV